MALQRLFEKLKVEDFDKFNDFRLHDDGTISFRMHSNLPQLLKLKLMLKERELEAVERDDKARGEDRLRNLLGQEGFKKKKPTNQDLRRGVQNMLKKAAETMSDEELKSLGLSRVPPGGSLSEEESKARKESGIAAIQYPQVSRVSEIQALKAVNFEKIHKQAFIDTEVLHDAAAAEGLLIDVNPRMVEINGKKELRGVIELLKKPLRSGN